jgi:hypothetical protein
MNMAYHYKDKAANVKQLNQYMLAKTVSMFEYQGLPDTLPADVLEKMLQQHGAVFVTKVEGEIYAFTGGIGGEVDVYNRPTQIVIANPALKFNKTLDLEKDGVLMRNDDFCIGLIPLFDKAHTMMVENDINMMVYGYNTRTQKLISASDDKTRESAELLIKRSIDGDISVIAENAIFDGVRVQSAQSSQSVTITSMTEFQQYLKGSLYNEVGLSSNFNMKRERLISSELDASEDSLFPFVYNMMRCRIEAVKKINEMFDLNIQVDFGSVWHFKNKELVDGVVKPAELPAETQPGVTENVPAPTEPVQPTEENTNEPTNQPTEPGTIPDETIPVVAGADVDTTGNIVADQKDQVIAMLEDATLSEDDIVALKELLAELEAKQ